MVKQRFDQLLQAYAQVAQFDPCFPLVQASQLRIAMFLQLCRILSSSGGWRSKLSLPSEISYNIFAALFITRCAVDMLIKSFFTSLDSLKVWFQRHCSMCSWYLYAAVTKKAGVWAWFQKVGVDTYYLAPLPPLLKSYLYPCSLLFSFPFLLGGSWVFWWRNSPHWMKPWLLLVTGIRSRGAGGAVAPLSFQKSGRSLNF